MLGETIFLAHILDILRYDGGGWHIIYCVGAEIGVLTRICGIDGMVIACCYEQFSNLSPIGQSIYTLSGAKIQKKSDFTPFRG